MTAEEMRKHSYEVNKDSIDSILDLMYQAVKQQEITLHEIPLTKLQLSWLKRNGYKVELDVDPFIPGITMTYKISWD